MKWLHLIKKIHSSHSASLFSDEDYVKLDEIKDGGYDVDNDNDLKNYAEIWFDIVNSEHIYNERGGEVEYIIVDTPPEGWLTEQIRLKKNIILSNKKDISLYKSLLKEVKPRVYIQMNKNINRFYKGQKVKTHVSCGYTELTIDSFKWEKDHYEYKFKEFLVLALPENSLYL